MTRHELFERLCQIADVLERDAHPVSSTLDILIDEICEGSIAESNPPLALRDLEARAWTYRMPSPTLLTAGQVAYEAWWQAYKAAFGTHGDDPWETIHPGTRQCWEASAQAAIAQWWRAHETIICGEEEDAPDV